MDSTSNSQIRANALEIIKNFRVPDLQALLDYARLPRGGNKRELFQRCKILLSAHVTQQLINKINQINQARINLSRTHQSISRNYQNQHSIVSLPTPPIDILPLPNQIQYIQLPFFEKMRTIDCINIPVDWNTFPSLRFLLTDYDVDFLLKGLAKVFLRIVPTLITEKQIDVLPPYLFVQCNGQIVINNNVSKTIGSPAHSTAFPTDITDKLIPKSNVHNTLNYLWMQSPVTMSFKNLPKSYTLAIQLVRYVPLNNLIENIVKREPQQTKLDNNDSDIEIEDIGLMTTRCRVSLTCPITQSLVVIPTKSSHCSHLTCFDLRPFLQMNERRLQWSCPLCKKPASYDTLRVDKRLQSILSNVPPNCSTVEIDSSSKILSDCQYILDNVKQEKTDIVTTASHLNDVDDDDDDEEEESIHNSSNKSRQHSAADDCIVLSSGSESEDEEEEEEVEDEEYIVQSNDSPVPTPLSNDLANQNSNTDERRTNTTSQPSNSIPSFQSLIRPNADDDGDFWEDIARITYDLMSDNNNNNEQNINRKRSNSSRSSLLSNNDDNHHRKRTKRSSDIEVITLSSNDSSDNDDQIS